MEHPDLLVLISTEVPSSASFYLKLVKEKDQVTIRYFT